MNPTEDEIRAVLRHLREEFERLEIGEPSEIFLKAEAIEPLFKIIYQTRFTRFLTEPLRTYTTVFGKDRR